MSGNGRYLFDSDVLVLSNRQHYSPEFCAAFWDWLDAGHNQGVFFSIDKVKGELTKSKTNPDVLHHWCIRPSMKNFFFSTKASTHRWQGLSQWALNHNPKFTTAATSKFLAGDAADAWLVAFAADNSDCQIVTNERSEPNAVRDIKLPDAASSQGIKTLSLWELLKRHAHKNFTFKP